MADDDIFGPTVKDVWDKLAAGVRDDIARCSSKDDRIQCSRQAFLRVSDLCVLKLGEASVRRNQTIVVIQVRIELGETGRASVFDYTHLPDEDTTRFRVMMKIVNEAAADASKSVLLAAFKAVAAASIGELGLDTVRSGLDSLMVEEVMRT